MSNTAKVICDSDVSFFSKCHKLVYIRQAVMRGAYTKTELDVVMTVTNMQVRQVKESLC